MYKLPTRRRRRLSAEVAKKTTLTYLPTNNKNIRNLSESLDCIGQSNRRDLSKRK